ncbi:oligogalacturonate lyase family protein [Halopiger aswanensis]|uniref:Oligogalacturonide lyase n=1 Tax=Halopiger aswanensis TaxID=148449 RepID=A0A3R7ECT7_9EURY|nr:oligogalacturonate lyase family protein [Halopiger aswanensis]RKD89243.1 oligogalacturonide lyase [Halopiger aswanensis]
MTSTNTIAQGPRAGSTWPAEWEEYDDPHTGARVTRLTSHPDDDYHLYFTEDGWYDDGRRLLFRSDRTGSRQLFSIDLESGLITQVTALEEFQGQTSIHHETSDAYFWVDDNLVRFDLERLEVTDVLYEAPEGYGGGSMDVNADGTVVYAAVSEAGVDLPGEEPRMDEMMEARPHTKILAVPIDGDGGDPELIHEEDRWVSSHVNASPTRPELFTFCQEGPWDGVEHRIWVADTESGDIWKVREVPEDAGIGHEYWMADGERIGYHGSMRDPQGRDQVDEPEPFIGSVRYDDTDRRETDLPDEVYALTHTHANSPELLVCDGSFTGLPYNILYRWDEGAGEYEGPRALATVDWKPESPHPHSRFSPDGSQVVFDSDRYDGSSNIYLVDVPAFESLPEYEPSEWD